jgi:hypothetical protein
MRKGESALGVLDLGIGLVCLMYCSYCFGCTSLLAVSPYMLRIQLVCFQMVARGLFALSLVGLRCLSSMNQVPLW